jgi:thioredoxin-like negative regulator of GroEL
MRLVHSEGIELIPTADELAIKIKAGLAEAGQGRLRLALERLIEVLAKDRADNRL